MTAKRPVSFFLFMAAATILLCWTPVAVASDLEPIRIPETASNSKSNNTTVQSSCASLATCGDCTNTYTCHWCEATASCHAKGSIHGCAWGSTCSSSSDDHKNKTGCASHDTCHECALSSHFCHWCEHDNACHAVGSRFGCALGVDCYSNDRCRRSEPEDLPLEPVLERIPGLALVAILVVAGMCTGCCCCCHYFATNVKGAYDDLAEMTLAGSIAPMSVIYETNHTEHRETFYTSLSDVPEDDLEDEDDDQVDGDNNNTNTAEEEPAVEDSSSDPTDDASPLLNPDPEPHDSSMERFHRSPNNNIHGRPLFHPSYNGSVVGSFQEPRHMKNLHRCCSYMLGCALLVVALFVGLAIFFFPQIPVYNVCNDEVAWSKIMKNIIVFELDASFEILASLSNPNRVGAFLERGKGSFSFDGKPFGTYEIPPFDVEAETITDFMIVVKVVPSDKAQAIRVAEAYYLGKLVLEADFEGTVRVPSLFNLTQSVAVQNIPVDVNALSDRSLCRCPTWNDDKNHSSSASLIELMETEWSPQLQLSLN